MANGYKAELTYGGYLKIPELLELQVCLSNPEEHDELQFIVVHQVFELWFKLMLYEMDRIIAALKNNNLRYASHLLRRVMEIQDVLIKQVDVLETMTPQDFLTFRNHLKPASGFQSWQFRELEIVSGFKDRRFVDHYKATEPAAYDQLQKRWQAPSLRDAYFDLLIRRGLNLPSGSSFEADLQTKRVSEILKIYADADGYYDLFQLSELLIDYDEKFLLWRQRHIRMVERMIGSKMGTGGSEGVPYLEGTLNKKFFPELWTVRTHISDKPT